MGNQMKIENCIFCNIILQDQRKEILFEDEKMIIINDIKPQAEMHILAISKRHIKNINYLTKDDIPLLKHMEEKVKSFIANIIPKEKLEELM